MLLTSQIAEVIKDLGLGSHFLTFRRYDAIVSRFDQGQRDILVFSEIDLYRDRENDHCSLLKAIDRHHFRLWIPLIGHAHEERDFPPDLWDAKVCHGLVLQPQHYARPSQNQSVHVTFIVFVDFLSLHLALTGAGSGLVQKKAHQICGTAGLP
jgi:hypothetical protein